MDARQYGLISKERLSAQSGLEFLRGLIAQTHPEPPFSEVSNMALEEAEYGRAVFVGRPVTAFLNPNGVVHGGWACALLDSAMAYAVHSTLVSGETYTSLEMKVNFVRPIKAGEAVSCVGTVIHRGKRVATSEGRILDAGGRILAHGTETCMIFGSEGRAERASREGADSPATSGG